MLVISNLTLVFEDRYGISLPPIDMAVSTVTDIALVIHIVAIAPISIPTAMPRLMSTPRSSSLRDRLNFTIAPRGHAVAETLNSRFEDRRLRESFRPSALKMLLSIQTLPRSLWQDA